MAREEGDRKRKRGGVVSGRESFSTVKTKNTQRTGGTDADLATARSTVEEKLECLVKKKTSSSKSFRENTLSNCGEKEYSGNITTGGETG